MGSGRANKRKHTLFNEQEPLVSSNKRLKFSDPSEHAVLSSYFPTLLSLREYILKSLPSPSRLRRKKISEIGKSAGEYSTLAQELSLGKLLDNTLVGTYREVRPLTEINQRDTWKQYLAYAQSQGFAQNDLLSIKDVFTPGVSAQSKIVDFVIWLLFSRAKDSDRPRNILCDGFRRGASVLPENQSPIPGLQVVFGNNSVKALKESQWCRLLAHLGACGQRLMIDMLVDCSVFVPVEAGHGNLLQLTGTPLFEIMSNKKTQKQATPADITFVRSRMFYARPALNSRNIVHFGLRHIHVLNRCPYIKIPGSCEKETSNILEKRELHIIKVMMYIFPRQFGLHNVFTSSVDFKKTTQKFHDYTMREEEINSKFMVNENGSRVFKAKIPKRLRGKTKYLIETLQKLHGRCSYSSMLQHYCPVPTAISNQVNVSLEEVYVTRSCRPVGKGTKKQMQQNFSQPSSSQFDIDIESLTLLDASTSPAQVSAFCQAVISNIVPKGFWGSSEIGAHNERCVLRQIDNFIKSRRFESLTLHGLVQGIKVMELDWLAAPHLQVHNASVTDKAKRVEIFNELLYYVFDSLLIPLVRTNFYVTESSNHRHRLFFFRHDVWKYIAEPAMKLLKTNMFEDVHPKRAAEILDSRSLGYSQLRLIPKTKGMRPIMNLKRRPALHKSGTQLGLSINKMLSPLQAVLKQEQKERPQLLGSSMFSVGEIYTRIKDFRSKILPGRRLFFAKVDVQSAFDTIPQEAIMELMTKVLHHNRYKVGKYVEVKPSIIEAQAKTTRPTLRWQSRAVDGQSTTTLAQALEAEIAINKTNTVFIDTAAKRDYYSQDLCSLLSTHIRQNIVKIAKKYYRQKNGIPQGSVLSSSLCNYFYADLERHRLDFISPKNSLLMRLIDDFLLITTERETAAKFVLTMHRGIPEFGVSVNPTKSLVNFDLQVDGLVISRICPEESGGFPYCGTFIDTRTLNLVKDRNNAKDPYVANSLTVEYFRNPGRSFQRKVLNSFRIQSHAMFYDMSLNRKSTLLSNLYSAYTESAIKMWAYARCLPAHKKPNTGLVIRTIEKLTEVSLAILTGNSRKERIIGYECKISRNQVHWLAATAFRETLGKKQSQHKEVIVWLDTWLRKLEGKKELKSLTVLKQIV